MPTNGYGLNCIYHRNLHNWVAGCGMRAPGNIRYWKICPMCGKYLVRGPGHAKDNECRYTKIGETYISGCGILSPTNVEEWNYCPFCFKPVIDLSREKEPTVGYDDRGRRINGENESRHGKKN